MEQDRHIRSTCTYLAEIADEVSGALGGQEALLNIKPSEKSWSGAECLEHLISTNNTYLPTLAALASGTYRSGLWARHSPFSAYFGSWLIKNTGAVVINRYKSPPVWQPVNSHVAGGIVSRFLAHQNALIAQIALLNDKMTAGTYMASPASPLITYSVKDALEIIVAHERRHIAQARRALESAKMGTKKQAT